MAYTKIIVIRGRLDKCLSYAANEEKTYLETAVDYVLDRGKTERVCFETAINCGRDTAYQDMMQPLLIETYYMSQFTGGGALLLLYYQPEEIIEEHWGEQDVDVMRFHCTEHFDARPEIGMDEYTLEQDIILMSNADAGWAVRVCGEIGMDELVNIAKNLEIRETGKVLTCNDFENHYAFMDGGVG